MKQLPSPTEPIRIDKYLTTQLPLSRDESKACIKKNHVFVNGQPAKAATTVTKNDQITLIKMPSPKDTTIKKEKNQIEMLYEDQDICVINKPSGLIVHPGPTQGTLVNALLYYPGKLSDGESEDRPGIVHRLDQFTEGLMVIAKNNKAHSLLKIQFKEREVTKKYVAMIKGNPKWEDIVITKPLGRHPKKRNRMTTHQTEGMEMKDAKTTIKVIKRFNTKTLVQAVPETGRMHQIRVHLAGTHHPVLGDTDYSSQSKQRKTDQKNQTKYLLQAYYLKFKHPTKDITLGFNLNVSKRILI